MGPGTNTAVGFHPANYPNSSLLNTKTIEEYSSGLIDGQYSRYNQGDQMNIQISNQFSRPNDVSNLQTIE